MSSKLVMCFGTFDILHPGHLSYFEQAKRYGDRLIVVVGRDSTVLRLKGKLPRHNEQERLAAIQAALPADTAVLGNEGGDFYAIIGEHRPDVIALGYDQKANVDALKERFPDIILVRLKSFEPEKYKSSLLKK